MLRMEFARLTVVVGLMSSAVGCASDTEEARRDPGLGAGGTGGSSGDAGALLNLDELCPQLKRELAIGAPAANRSTARHRGVDGTSGAFRAECVSTEPGDLATGNAHAVLWLGLSSEGEIARLLGLEQRRWPNDPIDLNYT